VISVRKNKKKTPPPAAELLDLILHTLDADKAEEMVVIDLAGKTSIGDFMVIASGTSTRHVGSMAGHLVEKLKDSGCGNVPTEGVSQGDWALIDGGDVIVHLFRPEIRNIYRLEKIWGDQAPREDGVSAIGGAVKVGAAQ